MTEQGSHRQEFSISRQEGDVRNGIVKYEVATKGKEPTTAYLPELPDARVQQRAQEIFDAQAFVEEHGINLSPTPTNHTVIEDGKKVDVFSRIQPLLLQQALKRAFRPE